jgi:hypothetical protein
MEAADRKEDHHNIPEVGGRVDKDDDDFLMAVVGEDEQLHCGRTKPIQRGSVGWSLQKGGPMDFDRL